MELRHVRYAVAVAEELHFGRAAERLFVAQPSLSRQIRELEADLGAQLFRRTSRRVELTPAGAAFLESARHAIAAAEATREATLAAAAGETGIVRLGFVTSAAIESLPQIIGLHRERHPGVRLILREMNTSEQVAALRNHEIDVGLTRDLTAEEGLSVTRLFHEPLLAAVPYVHEFRNRRSIDLVELIHADFVTLAHTRAPRAASLLAALEHQTNMRIRFTQEAHQYTTVLALVAAEVGVAVVPASVRALRRDDVHYLRLRDHGAWSEMHVTTLCDETRPTPTDLHRLIQEVLGTDGGSSEITQP